MDSNVWKWSDGSVSTELSAPTATERGLVRFDFGVVFANLRRYKLENDHLSIPESHPLFASIMDGLSSLGMEELLRRRWDDQYASLRAFQGKYGNCLVPEAHPTLGAWARIQCDHFGRYRQQLPSPLTKERFHKLKEIDFGELAEVVNRKGARRGNDLRQPRGGRRTRVRPRSSSPRPGARAGRNPPARPTDGAHRHTVPVSSLARGRRRSVSAPSKPISFRPTNLSRSVPNRASVRKNGHVRESPFRPTHLSQSLPANMHKNGHVRESKRKPPARQIQSFDSPKERKPPTRQMRSFDDRWQNPGRVQNFNLESRSTNTRRTGRGGRLPAGNVHEKRRLRRSRLGSSRRGRGKSIADEIEEEREGNGGDSTPERHLSSDDIHVDYTSWNATPGAPAASGKSLNFAQYQEGQRAVYTNSEGSCLAVITKVHFDDDLIPYYTIDMNGREKQTVEARLSVAGESARVLPPKPSPKVSFSIGGDPSANLELSRSQNFDLEIRSKNARRKGRESRPASGRRRSVSAPPKSMMSRPTNLSRSTPHSFRPTGASVRKLRDSRQILSFDAPKEKKFPSRQIQSFDDRWESPRLSQKSDLEIRWKDMGRTGSGGRPPAGNAHETGREGRPAGNMHEKRRVRRAEIGPSRRGWGKIIVNAIEEEMGGNDGDDGDSSPERLFSEDDIHVDYTDWTVLAATSMGSLGTVATTR